MLDLLEMLENGIVEREEVIASAKKEAEKMHDYIENFEVEAARSLERVNIVHSWKGSSGIS